MKKTVLVTGGSGFIAIHCITQLLQQGYTVRATLRSLKRSDLVQAMLKEAGVTDTSALSFTVADLESDKGWPEAVAGCHYVIHVASPTPNTSAKTEDDFVLPAKNGVLRVLRAARDAGVERVVLTSAFGAVGFGTSKTVYTEEDWTNINANIPPYQKSKTIAEKAAWDFIAQEGNGMQLSVVNPVGVLGPVLAADFSHSIQTIYSMLKGTMPGCPKLSSGYVDVRDVADLHIKAMISPAANGQRFLAVAGDVMSLMDIANILRRHLGEQASKVPTREIPNWQVRLASLFNPAAKLVLPFLGMVKGASNDKARRLLSWQPRSNEDAVLATAKSLIRLDLVK